MSRRDFQITPTVMLRAYRAGLFPMAQSRDCRELYWLDPEMRGVLPMDRGFHVPRRLWRCVESTRFVVTADQHFPAVINACAQPAPGREESWINGEIQTLFTALYRQGHAHSIEVFEHGELVGGLYGVAMGAAFFGESMFSKARDASKVALVHLVARLRLSGFTLLDTQFVTSHLAQFGAIEIPRDQYRARLALAAEQVARFPVLIESTTLENEFAFMRKQNLGD